jgi:hypothetical protein
MAMNPTPTGAAPQEGFQPAEYRCVTSLGEIKAGIMAAMRHQRLNPEFRLAEASVVRVEDEWDDLDQSEDLLDYFGGIDSGTSPSSWKVLPLDRSSPALGPAPKCR